MMERLAAETIEATSDGKLGTPLFWLFRFEPDRAAYRPVHPGRLLTVDRQRLKVRDRQPVLPVTLRTPACRRPGFSRRPTFYIAYSRESRPGKGKQVVGPIAFTADMTSGSSWGA